MLAAAAVTVIAAQAVFVPHETAIVVAEAALLMGLLTATVATRHRRMLDRWISYRFLAERLRSSYSTSSPLPARETAVTGRAGPLICPARASGSWCRAAAQPVRASRVTNE